MKDAYDLMNNGLSKMNQLLDNKNIIGCARYSSYLINTFSLMDFIDGVFICETLESSFLQLDRAVYNLRGNGIACETIESDIKKYLDEIEKSYKDQNKNRLYASLRGLRSFITEIQLESSLYFKRDDAEIVE